MLFSLISNVCQPEYSSVEKKSAMFSAPQEIAPPVTAAERTSSILPPLAAAPTPALIAPSTNLLAVSKGIPTDSAEDNMALASQPVLAPVVITLAIVLAI